MFRMLAAILLPIVSAASPSMGQTSTPEEIFAMTHASFQNATTPEAIESIATWCRDSLSTLSVKERERLTLSAAASIEKNKLEEANDAMKRVKEIEALDKNMADLNCKPNSIDDAIRTARKSKIR
jgi:uncharacterized protein YbaP (TraB family)